MAITACVRPESGRIVYAWFDFQHPFQICFSKEGMDHIVLWQNRPGSDLDGLVRVWRNASGLEASRCAGTIGPGFWEDATGPLPVFSLSDSVAIIHSRPGLYCEKPARIRFSSGRLCQVLAKRIRFGGNPVCKNHPVRFRPKLPSRSGPDANRIRHVYWASFA